jgi:hypothetical protein
MHAASPFLLCIPTMEDSSSGVSTSVPILAEAGLFYIALANPGCESAVSLCVCMLGFVIRWLLQYAFIAYFVF